MLERNRLTSWLKIFEWRTLALLVPAMLLTELVSYGFGLLNGPAAAAAKVRALLDVLGALPAGSLIRDRLSCARRQPLVKRDSADAACLPLRTLAGCAGSRE